jgi:Skp family chaperone for outer membrane proteins
MKAFRMVFVITTLISLQLLAQAQSRMVTSTTLPNPGPVAAAGPIGVIDSSMFSHDKEGILRVVAAMNQVEQKFEPLRKEINSMRERLVAMQSDITKKAPTQAPSVTAQQTEAARQLDLQVKRKAEDAQSDFQKQLNAALNPLQIDINNAINTYAQSKGIMVIIDSARVPIIYVHQSVDITKDFIAEYNRTHPATATPAPARP